MSLEEGLGEQPLDLDSQFLSIVARNGKRVRYFALEIFDIIDIPHQS